MPWLVAAGHCIGVHDAAIHRVALPEDARAAACRGSFDNWLALVPLSPPPFQPFLLNPFTGARIQLPAWTTGGTTICKIILSSAPDSDKCTVAAVVASELGNNTEQRRGSIAVCRLSQQEGSSSPWWCIAKTFYLEDIAFFQGKLHAVDGAEQTYVFEDDELEKMRAWALFQRDPVARFSAHKRYYLVACHGRLLMVCRSFGTNRVPDGVHHHHSVGFRVSAVTEHSYGRTSPPAPVPVKNFDGHALFVGEACCRAFSITDEGSKIKANQICYADDEISNTSPVVIGGDSIEGINCHRPPGSSLQSYDMRTDCFRRYQPRRRPAAGLWQCVTMQRLLHRDTMPPPPATEWGATLLLWEVMGCLGASRTPCYYTGSESQDPGTHAVGLSLIVYDQGWSFTQRGRSVQEAKQEVAREALSFLRSRFRTVLDDSPWSSIPYYHSHVSEDAYDDEDLEDESN